LHILPTEIWLLILRLLRPKELQAVMRVNHLWYSVASEILCNTISNLLAAKDLVVDIGFSGRSLMYAYQEHILPSTWHSQSKGVFYNTPMSDYTWYYPMQMNAFSLLELLEFESDLTGWIKIPKVEGFYLTDAIPFHLWTSDKVV
jgi:hypothetical protein